jgi:hypothetical protein
MNTIQNLPTRQQDPAAERAKVIAGLRALVDIFEAVPEIPIQECFGWTAGGRDDTGIPVMEAAAEALAAAGVPHEYTVHEDFRQLFLTVGAVQFGVSHAHDSAILGYAARSSYTPVVQVDAEVPA